MTPVVAPAIVALPGAAWRGLVGRYRDVVSPCTEAPDVFHLASFITTVGCLIGRKAWVSCPHRTYPNFYSLLVGKTASARKTTAYQFALNLFDEAIELIDDPQVKKLNGLATVEGLASTMINSEPSIPWRILCVEDEFRTLITKSRQHANLIPKLTELFNCPATFEVNTRTQPIIVQNPFLAVLAASTESWFASSLTQRDVNGGFLNRWLLFEGDTDKLLPIPPSVAQAEWEELILRVAVAVDDCGGEYRLTEEAQGFYVRVLYRCSYQFQFRGNIPHTCSRAA